ncbi:rhomboid family intramembrane serine protease [Quisquiliibacterium transsilvanicum]|jgi:rhomboid protease GluP|uniref:Membrane associated rhomboid family serine protease n=1 Tax=Quisquiliibacterium transsilvanicum TaxID=1549638 RepID=A0A7W8HJ05_9BURK|nr:rhomboid family intramembrane serine protease [Quisquiliibacterium transsilvanicum]MBB5272093.1 membrane associated rhomboid family serine protease [Quisquiliibacterium transsilvanicum]
MSAEEDFAARLAQATPRTWATQAIVVANVAIWLAMLATGTDPMRPDVQSLIDWGANLLPLTVDQPWRLMTATILHAGLVHLGFNMWVLWDAGRIAERFYGSLQFLLIYLISGLFGSLASLFFAARTGVSVGASGAIFGVVGALLAALFTKQSKLPPGLAASMRSSMLLFVGYSLFMGFISSFIDNAAHIGGLLSGFAAAVILAERFDWEEYRRSAVQRSILAIGAAMVAAFLVWKMVPVPVA